MVSPTSLHQLDDAALDALAATLAGRLVRPSDDGYDEARQVMNALVDRRPAAVVLARDADDVARAVVFARDHGLELAVRSGGHSIAGHSTTDGGILIDVAGLDEIHIDPDRRVGTAGAGVKAGAYTAAAFEHGLATPFGDTAGVGLGGLTVGGGVGWLSRTLGLTIDSLLSVEVVTAAGERIVASETEHPDLFWAIRGGGGNFGVATRFEYRLHPMGIALGGALFLPLTRDVLAGALRIAAAAPDELGLIMMAMRVPPMPFVPAEHHGAPALAAMLVYAGDPEAGQAAVAPLRALATPLVDMVAPMPYPAIFQLTEGAAHRAPLASRSVFLPAVDDAVVDTILEHMATAPSPMVATQIRVLGGAISRVPNEATAYAFRDRQLLIAILDSFEDPADADRQRAWVADYQAALRGSSVGTYVNFLDDEGPDAVRAAYPHGAYERLVEVKRRYDPENLFRLNQNIAP